MLRSTLAAAIAAAALAPAVAPAVAGATSAAPSFDYAVIGDTPYGSSMINAFPSHIADINNDPDTSLVMHLGDIKNGSSRCDTSYFEQIKADFDTFEDPLVYTPGDNEWTDCHRTNNGGYQPARVRIPGAPVITDAKRTRLEELRRIFFPVAGETLGKHKRQVISQNGPKENVRWVESGVEFATYNVPGSNNDLLPWFGAAETPALAEQQQLEYSYRNKNDIRWLDAAFNDAITRDAKAVVIGLQADMWDPAITGDPTQYSGFTKFARHLAYWCHRYKKPVLLLNGDSHQYEADQPLADPAATNSKIYGVPYAVKNLTRVTVDGSAAANDWLKLHVDPSSPTVFSWTRVNHTLAG